MQPDEYANSFAIQMWRHKLMHTGSPRKLIDEQNGTAVRWLLHWGDEHLPRDQHFIFQDNGTVFNMSLFGLLNGINRAVTKYGEELTLDERLVKNYQKMQNLISSYKLGNKV